MSQRFGNGYDSTKRICTHCNIGWRTAFGWGDGFVKLFDCDIKTVHMNLVLTIVFGCSGQPSAWIDVKWRILRISSYSQFCLFRWIFDCFFYGKWNNGSFHHNQSLPANIFQECIPNCRNMYFDWEFLAIRTMCGNWNCDPDDSDDPDDPNGADDADDRLPPKK